MGLFVIFSFLIMHNLDASMTGFVAFFNKKCFFIPQTLFFLSRKRERPPYVRTVPGSFQAGSVPSVCGRAGGGSVVSGLPGRNGRAVCAERIRLSPVSIH